MLASLAQTTPQRAPDGRIGAVLLIGASLLEALGLSVHPHVHAHDMTEVVAQLASLAPAFARVHAGLSAVLLLGFVGLTEFARRRDLKRPLVHAGLTAYGAGVLAMIAAALAEGVVAPRIAAHALSLGAAGTQATAQLINLCLQFNLAFAVFAVVSMAAGIGLWSLDLVRGTGALRVLGLLGLAGLAGAMGLVFSLLPTEHGLVGSLVVQMLWSAGAGLLLWRGGHVAYQPMP
jgi:hypothetical protein